MGHSENLINRVTDILSDANSPQALKIKARQVLFLTSPLSKIVETFLSNNEGQAQNLDKFPQLRLIYDNLPQKLLLKCSRKTLKSTLLSNMLVINMLRYNYYKMLYVAPMELSTKYFSNNYLNTRFESPGIKKITDKFDKYDVFEKSLPSTHSSILLRYCSTDPQRLRGPCIDLLVADECFSVNTNILINNTESRPILDIKPGDVILAHDSDKNIKYDRVRNIKARGKRATWRVTLSDGKYIECTSREQILTNRGWVYLAELLSLDEIKRCDKAIALESAYRAAKAISTGNTIRGWMDEFSEEIWSHIPLLPWDETGRLCNTPSSNNAELYKYSSLCELESGIQQNKRELSFQYGNYTGIRVYTHNVLRKNRGEIHKNCKTRMVRPTYLGRHQLLVFRRRLYSKNRESYDVRNEWLPKRTSRLTSKLVKSKRGNMPHHTYIRPGKNVLYHSSPSRRLGCINRQHQTICTLLFRIQAKHTKKILSLLQCAINFRTKNSLYKHFLSKPDGNRPRQKQSNSSTKSTSSYPKTTEILPNVPSSFNRDTTPILRQLCKIKEESFRFQMLSETQITSIEYIGEQEVYDLETEKYHTFFANGIAVHNCQDISYDAIPIIQETMAMSRFKREIYAGTPLTTDNTIHEMWKRAHQVEWMTKCTSCNHWNSLTEDNEPMKMILKEGISCSKCSKLIDTTTGQWIDFNPGERDFYGFHLAQPILPHFNQDPKEWKVVYNKATNGKYTVGQVYNEVFGLAYDLGQKPMTEETLKKLCVLGEMESVISRNRAKYMYITCGADWGVNMQTSRTAVCLGGLREDGVYEVFFMKIYHDFDYNGHIRDIAARANKAGSYCAADSGPDPNRGIMLAQLTSWEKTQLVRYERGKLVQRYDVPVDSIHPSQNRWCLHRSDTMTFTFNEIKEGRVLFPRWEDSSEGLQDILNVNVEVREGELKQELIYSHPPLKADDFMHALNFALCQAHLLGQNQLLNCVSSTGADPEWSGGSMG